MQNFHVIDGHTWVCRWAWFPKLCKTTPSASEWRWNRWYWRNGVVPGSENVSPNMMDQYVEEERQRLYAALPPTMTSQHASSQHASTASSISIGARHPMHASAMTPDLEQNIRAIVEQYVYELEKKFMDELFASLPANTVPQEQIDRIYDKMGYDQ